MIYTDEERNLAKKHAGISIPADTKELSNLEMDELRSKQIRAGRGTRDMLNAAQKANRDLSDSESRAFDVSIGFQDEIADEIQSRGHDDNIPFLPDSNVKTVTSMVGGDNSYRSLFGNPSRSTAGFRNLGEMVIAIKNGDNDKLRQLRNVSVGVGSEGGVAIPEIWWSQIFDSGVEASVALDRCTIFRMDSQILHIPAWDSSDHGNGPIANVAGSWMGELDTATRVTPKTRLLTFNAHKLGIWVGISSEATQDSAALSKSLAPMMSSSLGFTLDEALLTGNGVAKPAGILNSAATIHHERATANSIGFSDLKNMMGRLLPTSLGKAIWVVSPSAFAILLGVEVATTSGHLAMSSTPGAGKLNMELLGHPVRVSEKLPSLGTTGDVLLADFAYYGLGLRSGARYETTNAAQWTEDVQDHRLIIRADGAGLVQSAMTPAGGGNTLSPFVVLD